MGQHHIFDIREGRLRLRQMIEKERAGEGNRKRGKGLLARRSWSVLTVIFPCWGKFTYLNWPSALVCNSPMRRTGSRVINEEEIKI